MFENYIISPMDGLVPAAVSLVVMVPAWRPWKRTGAETRGRWGAPVALAAGFAAAFKSINGALPQQFPPPDAKLWLFWIAIGAGVIGLIDALARPPNWARLIEAALLS